MIILQITLIIVLILWTSKQKSFQFIYNILPPIFWIYFIPMFLSNVGYLPSKHAVYDFAVSFILPFSLTLMLVNSKLSLIQKIGKPALILMLTGSLGIMIGTPIAALIFKPFIPADVLPALGTLAASWMGGSFNMIAVKEATGISDSAFSPLIIVDTIIGYSWMGFLIFLSRRKHDKEANENFGFSNDLNAQVNFIQPSASTSLKYFYAFVWMILAAVIATGMSFISSLIPEIPGILTSYAWLIILITTFSLILSLYLSHKDFTVQTARYGQWLLYFILATIGAKAQLAGLRETIIYISAGLFILLIHAGILFFAVRSMKLPIALFATASQANIGGVVSAPIVASVYHPSLAPVGLLMAIIGNIAGTYLGIVAVTMCRWISNL